MAKLWNRDSKPFSQKTPDGRLITIEPGKFVRMSRRDAVVFNGLYPGYQVVKALEIELEPIGSAEKKFICNADGKEFDTKEALQEHLDKINPKKEEPSKTYACPICDEEFQTKPEFDDHWSANHKPGRKGKVVANDSSASSDTGTGSDD